LEKASVPFFEMVEKWVYEGIIHDTYGEFFVEQHEGMRKEELVHDYNDGYPIIIASDLTILQHLVDYPLVQLLLVL
jgi:hypothetical protein